MIKIFNQKSIIRLSDCKAGTKIRTHRGNNTNKKRIKSFIYALSKNFKKNCPSVTTEIRIDLNLTALMWKIDRLINGRPTVYLRCV